MIDQSDVNIAGRHAIRSNFIDSLYFWRDTVLSYSCEFPVPNDVSRSSVFSVIRRWITGMRFTHFDKDSLAQLGDGEAWEAVQETEYIESLVEVTADVESCAVVYCKKDDQFEWITTVVFAIQPSSNWISVRVECEPLHPMAVVPAAKKPVLVKLLLQEFGGGIDGDFEVVSTPIIFAQSEIDLAGRCVRGETDSYLPIVYVSAPFVGPYLVNPNELATQLAGMAHIVVEPNRAFSTKLMAEVDRRNPYGGTVALYWPESGERRSLYSRGSNRTSADIHDSIFTEIRLSLNNRRPLVRCTLNSIKELKSRRQINALKDAGSKEVNRYIEVFEDDIRVKEAALESAEKEIHRLKAANQRFAAQDTSDVGLSIVSGKECDFYDNEIKSIICSALENEMANVAENSRAYHVLSDLLKANPMSDERLNYRDQIKSLLRDYQSMDAKTRRELEQMGFSISDGGKHYKLVFNEDERYTLILPKTGSDHRGGLNSVSDFCRLLFR